MNNVLAGSIQQMIRHEQAEKIQKAHLARQQPAEFSEPAHVWLFAIQKSSLVWEDIDTTPCLVPCT